MYKDLRELHRTKELIDETILGSSLVSITIYVYMKEATKRFHANVREKMHVNFKKKFEIAGECRELNNAC